MRQASSSRPSPSFCAAMRTNARERRVVALSERARVPRASIAARSAVTAAPSSSRSGPVSGRPTSISARRSPSANDERAGRIGQVRVEIQGVDDGVVPVLRLQAQLLAVLRVERQLRILRERVAEGLQEGVVELAGGATAAEGAGDDLTEPVRIRVRRSTHGRGHL